MSAFDRSPIGFKADGALSVAHLASEWKMLDTVCAHLVKQMATKCVEWSSVLELMRTRLERLWIGTGAAMMQREREKAPPPPSLPPPHAQEAQAEAEAEAPPPAASEGVPVAMGESDDLAAHVTNLRVQLAEAEAKLAARGDGRWAARPEALRSVAAGLIAQAEAAERQALGSVHLDVNVDAGGVPRIAIELRP